MKATVAISSDFFKAFSKLPRAPQSKVSEFVSKFQADPTSNAINLEKIKDALDPKMRSVRIDQKYRGIVLAPKTGTVFMLLWVDDHDDAYAWARRHRCNINPETGTIQIYAVRGGEVEEKRASVKKPAQPEVPGVFDHLKDKRNKSPLFEVFIMSLNPMPLKMSYLMKPMRAFFISSQAAGLMK